MAKSKLICTASTKEELQNLINEFYYSTRWIIKEDNKLINTKTNKTIDNSVVRLYRNKWRFELA